MLTNLKGLLAKGKPELSSDGPRDYQHMVARAFFLPWLAMTTSIDSSLAAETGHHR